MSAVTGGSSQPVRPKIRRDGITVLVAKPQSTVDIVFVHGLNGHPEETWKHSATGFLWPWEIQNHVSDARVMLFGYDADISPQLGTNLIRIRSLAEALLSGLVNKRQEDSEIDRPLIFIAHSLGGLLVKKALVLASQTLLTEADDAHHIYNASKALMFFGTPNAGSAADKAKRVWLLKKIAKAVFTEVPPKLESALDLHSDELLDLADDFRKTSLCVRRELTIYTYYETHTTAKLGDRVVDEFSAKIGYDKETSLPIQADHEHMVKFEGEDSGDYENVWEKMRILKRRATGAIGTVEVLPESVAISPGQIEAFFSPALAKKRILCFSDSGARSLASLYALKEVMNNLKHELRLPGDPLPSDVFDLIGGSGTGGLLAIFFGVLDMTCDEAIVAFCDLLHACFSDTVSFMKRGFNPLSYRFSGQTLELFLKELCKMRGIDANAVLQMPSRRCKTFVCVTRVIECPDTGKLMVQDVETTPLRTYECLGWPTAESCCIWEAGRATMAYPSFFPPIQISGARGVPGNTYLGSLFQSNPSFTALNEAKNLWNSKIADIGVLLSLGGASTASRMYLPNNGGLSGMFSDLSSLFNTLASTAGAIERTHRHIEILFNEASTRQEQAYFRLDPGDALADVPYQMTALAIERIRGLTANYLQDPKTYATVKACAKALTEIARGEIIGLAMATGAAAKLTVEEHAELQQSLRLLRESLGDEMVITSSHQETLHRRLTIVEAAVLQLKADENAQSSLSREWRTATPAV